MSYIVNLEFDGPVLLKSVKVRKEGKDDQRVIATVLQFKCNCDVSFIARLWRTDITKVEKALRSVMYGSGNLFRTELGEIKLSPSNKFTDHHAIVKIDNEAIEMDWVTVGKFAIKSEAGVPKLHFEVVAEPDVANIGPLADGLIHQDVFLTIAPPSQEDMVEKQAQQEESNGE